MYKHKWVLLADDMGLGKTYQCLKIIHTVKATSLIVVPAILRSNWQSEFKKLAGLDAVVIESSKDFGRVRAKYFIISYALFITLQPNKVFNIVIFDEAHALKNPDSQRAAAAKHFLDVVAPDYCFFLTGTPFDNSVTELFTMLSMLSQCPHGTNGIPLKEKTEYAFGMRFSYLPLGLQQIGKPKFRGIRNEQALKSILKGKYLRRVASKVLNLPPISVKEVKADIFDDELDRRLSKAYMEWEDTASGEERDHITQVKLDAAMFKVPFTVEYAKQVLKNTKKIIIFSDHVPSAEAIAELLTGSKIKTSLITGKVLGKKRDRQIDLFTKGATRVLVGTFKTTATGLNLTQANHAIFNDFSWRPSDMSQGAKRMHRIGQEKPCVVHTIAFGAFDVMIQRKLKEKIRVINKVL